MLIGDDEHGWSQKSVFNIEGGCYAKTINIKRETEPQIWDAIRFGSMCENVVIDPATRLADYDDDSLTENGRVAYPVEFIDNAVVKGRAKRTPDVVIFLTADAFGVLPPISKLDENAAMVFETLDKDQFQPVGTVNYTVSENFTRITEFKNMTGQVVAGKTTILREYSRTYIPGVGETPYYVINEPENIELYKLYRKRVEGILSFHCVGRLAEYRYYDMDGVVASALDLSDEIIAAHN